ncbi:MAG TPA: DUF5399 family protein [Rhabdochlamydiaceae bacterium]|nr:DUF5399 family protein [Rhabdochlamydiaceae bacterium]
MNRVTIDKLDIKDHVRWAKDQLDIDPAFAKESHYIPPHSEIFATSIIYFSKWEMLFEIQRGHTAWANFCPPKNFHLQSKRFFSYRIFPYLHWDEKQEEEEEEGKQEEQENKCHDDLFERAKKATPPHDGFRFGFEQDRSAVINLLEAIKYLNRLLAHINARKLQYQRG